MYKHLSKYTLIGLFAVLLTYITTIDRVEYLYFYPTRFEVCIVCIAILYMIYFWILYKNISFSKQQIIVFAVLFRALMCFSPPNLSDDYYRHIWDAKVCLEGKNPYAYTPNEIKENYPECFAKIHTDNIYDKLNSPQWHTVYSPMLMGIYTLGLYMGKTHENCIYFVRVCTVLLEIGILCMLFSILGKGYLRTVIYAFNPLIIIELMANLHSEIWMLFFLVSAIYFEHNKRPFYTLLCVLLACVGKITALIFLPIFLLRVYTWNRKHISVVCLCLACVGVLEYYIIADIQGFLSSLALYATHFEFNASLFYLVREIGLFWVNYDIIDMAGPLLMLLACQFIGYLLYVYIRQKHRYHYIQMSAYIYIVYLLCSTTVHPWYISVLVVFACIYTNVFSLVWSALIFLSYHVYQTPHYTEYLSLVCLEYGLLIAVVVYMLYKNSIIHPKNIKY